jgi:hypothetical protein
MDLPSSGQHVLYMGSGQANLGRRVGAESKLQRPLQRTEHVLYTCLQHGGQGVSQQARML